MSEALAIVAPAVPPAGSRNGRLVVLEVRGRLLLCRCDCGTERQIYASRFRSDRIRSCGCNAHPKGLVDPVELAERMERFSIPEPNSGCVLWLGTVSRGGYSMLSVGGRPTYGHRAAYEAVNGPIPGGLDLDHLCRVRSCINPRHLEAVTRKVNCLRGISLPAQNSRKTHCLRGHPIDRVHRVHGRVIGRVCSECNRIRSRAAGRAR